MSKSEWLDRLRLRNFRPAIFARAPFIVIPKIEHCLAEMLHDVATIEIDIFHERAAVIAIKNDVLVLAGRATPLDHHANCVRRPHRGVRNIRRNKKRLTFAHEMIDDAIAFADAHLDIAFKLVKIFFRIDEMKIIPRVWPFDHHHEEIAAIIKIAVAHRRLE